MTEPKAELHTPLQARRAQWRLDARAAAGATRLKPVAGYSTVTDFARLRG